jgi:hypothetical protein
MRIVRGPSVRRVSRPLATAVERSREQFPPDAYPRTPAPDAGDFVALYKRDSSGAITSVVVAAGDDLDTIHRDAAS